MILERSLDVKASLTVFGEIKQFRQVLHVPVWMTRIGETAGRVTELIKERVAHCFDSRETLSRSVLK